MTWGRSCNAGSNLLLLKSASHMDCQLHSWLLSFGSSSLVMCLGGRCWLKALNPCHPCGRPCAFKISKYIFQKEKKRKKKTVWLIWNKRKILGVGMCFLKSFFSNWIHPKAAVSIRGSLGTSKKVYIPLEDRRRRWPQQQMNKRDHRHLWHMKSSIFRGTHITPVLWLAISESYFR